MKSVAVIGSGISGLSAAYFLSRKYKVTLFEKEDRLGGHTHTQRVTTEKGTIALDTGFLVHNDRTYPNLVRLFRELGVSRQMSDMSFGVTSAPGGFEYSSRGLRGIFSRKRNAVRPRYYRFLLELLRFNRQAHAFLNEPEAGSMQLSEFLDRGKFSKDFSRFYLYPMASAVWSTSINEIAEFPAATLIRFFDNHGFLGLTTQHQWHTLCNGNDTYIAPLSAPYRDHVRLSARILSVTRFDRSVAIHFPKRPPEHFDEVVFACSAPDVLSLLSRPTPSERGILSEFHTSRNEAVLHVDASLLPYRDSSRASWNYHVEDGNQSAAVTYHLNRLQNLRSPHEFCVTLNHTSAIARDQIVKRVTYWHPLYTRAAVAAQARWSEISGKNRTHFCGAYWHYGFHEDGLRSAMRVAAHLGAEWQHGEVNGTRDLHRDAAAPPDIAGAPPVHVPTIYGAAGY